MTILKQNFKHYIWCFRLCNITSSNKTIMNKIKCYQTPLCSFELYKDKEVGEDSAEEGDEGGFVNHKVVHRGEGPLFFYHCKL